MDRVHPSVRIHETARITVKHLVIGEGSTINAFCRLEGERIEIGRCFWMDENAVIGGGSCHDPCAFLKAGDFLHMGMNSQINIARGVEVGNEVGIGIETKIFTHGAYLSEIEGFPVAFAPVKLGHRVWLPNAWVNPGVTIGSDVVVAARSLVNADIPSGALAGGIPARVLKSGIYPRHLSAQELRGFGEALVRELHMLDTTIRVQATPEAIVVDDVTTFHLVDRRITGPATPHALQAQNQLRRHGVRFRYSAQNGQFLAWGD